MFEYPRDRAAVVTETRWAAGQCRKSEGNNGTLMRAPWRWWRSGTSPANRLKSAWGQVRPLAPWHSCYRLRPPGCRGRSGLALGAKSGGRRTAPGMKDRFVQLCGKAGPG